MSSSRPKLIIPREINKVFTHLDRHSRFLMQLLNIDLERAAQGISAIFPLDYHEIFGYIHEQAGGTEKRVVKYYIDNLKHPLVILPPTVWEFLRHMKRLSDHLRHQRDTSSIDVFLESPKVRNYYEKVESGAHPKEIVDAYKSMGQFRTIIDFLGKNAVRRLLEAPIGVLIKLIDDKRLQSLEQVIGEVTIGFDETAYQKILKQLNKERPDKEVNNRVDALNLAMTLNLNETYYTSSHPSYFAFVTHAKLTEREYSKIRWQGDPLAPKRSRGLQINRDHYYCAYRAYFEESHENPIVVTYEYLEEIDRVRNLFYEKVLELNRTHRPSLNTMSDHEIASLFEEEFGALGYLLDDEIVRISPEALRKIGRPALPEKDGFPRIPNAEQIRSVLETSHKTVIEKAREAYAKMERMLTGFDPELVDPNWIEVLEWLESGD